MPPEHGPVLDDASDCDPGTDRRVSPGRPRDAALTERLLATALTVLADEGLEHLTFESLARRIGAGKAAVYRRWPSVAAMLEEAVRPLALIDPPPDEGSLRRDLFALLRPWTTGPVTRDQQVVGALFSAAHVHPEVRRALFVAVVTPLHEAMAELTDRARDRGEVVPAARARLLSRLVQAVWWERGMSFAEPLSDAELWSLIDHAFLPPSTQNTTHQHGDRA